MSDTISNPNPSHWNALRKIVKRLPANLAYYGSALGAIILAGGGQLPPGLDFVAGSIGGNMLSNMIADILKDEDLLDDEIRQRAEDAITQSDIANLLTKQDFLQGYARLIQRLDAQKTISQDILDELRIGFGKVATADQVEELKRLILQFSRTQTTSSVRLSAFISYARKDAKDFAKQLSEDLKALGVEVWLDLSSMPSGDTFIAEIDRAIQRADYFLLIATSGAIQSPYCQDEWKKALEHFKPIIPLLLMGEYADLPEEAHTKLNDARDFRDLSNYKEQLARLLDQLKIVPSPVGKLLGAPDLPRHYLIRRREISELRTKLTSHKTTVLSSPVKRVGIHGMGGIGKSVMATALTRDYFVRRAFPDGVFWLTIGMEPSLSRLWVRLRQWLGGGTTIFRDGNEAKDFFQENTANKECLIILDDVWDVSQIEALMGLGDKCRLLVTSRYTTVLQEIDAYSYELGLLNNHEARTLLTQTAELSIAAMPDVANGITKACGNLPLALSMIGAMVRKKPVNYWKDALEALSEADLKDIAAKFPDYPYPNLFAAMEVSIHALDSTLRESYYDFAIFPNSIAIPEVAPLTLWKPIKEREGRQRLNELVSRNLLRRGEDGSLSIHDLQLAYIRKQAIDLNVRHERLMRNYNPKNLLWSQLSDDGYLYDYLTYHLYETGRKTELFTLLTSSSDWMEAKFLADGDDSSFARDLALAMKDFHDPVTPDQFVTLTQLQTVRQVINARTIAFTNSEIALLVLMGRTREAINHVYLRADALRQFYGLIQIHNVLRDKFQIDSGLLENAEIIASHIQDSSQRASAFTELVEALVGNKEFDKAEAIARSIESESSRVSALTTLAKSHSDTNEDYARALFTEAEAIAKSIDEEPYRANTLQLIAKGLIEVRRLDEAERIARAIEDWRQPELLSEVAKTMVELGNFEEAEATVHSIHDESDRIKFLCKLAETFARFDRDRAEKIFDEMKLIVPTIGDNDVQVVLLWLLTESLANASYFDDAMVIARKIASEDYQANALRSLVSALANHGHFEEAKAIVPSIRDDHERIKALTYLGTAFAEAGRLKEVEVVIHDLQNEWGQVQVLGDLAIALTEVGTIDRALEIVRSIPSYEVRSNLLRGIIWLLIEKGDSRAKSIFDLLVQSSRQETQDYWRFPSTLMTVAASLAQAKANNIELVCTKIADIIVDSEYLKVDDRDNYLGGLAAILWQIGYISEAKTIASRISNDDTQVSTLMEIEKALRQYDNLDQAKLFVNAIPDSYHRGLEMTHIASMFIENNNADARKLFEEAEKLAHTISSEIEQSVVLESIAEALAKAGLFDWARNVVHSVPGDYQQVKALGKLAARAAKAGNNSFLNTIIGELEEIMPTLGYRRVSTISSLGLALAANDDKRANAVFDDAEILLHSIKDDLHMKIAFDDLVEALAQSRYLVKAHVQNE